MAVNLGQKIGPLPLGGWLAAAGGGVAIALYTKASSGNTQTIEHRAVLDESGNPVLPESGVGGSWLAVPPPSSAPPGAPDPTTNEEWGRQAIDYLLAKGVAPDLADSAIRRYLVSESLSGPQWAVIRIAILGVGSPPVPMPPAEDNPTSPGPVIPTTPTPTPTPTPQPVPVVPRPVPVVPRPAPSPVRGSWVTVGKWPAWNGSLWGIAGRYYKNSRRWPDIYNANKVGAKRPDGTRGTIVNPALIYPGTRLWVPQ